MKTLFLAIGALITFSAVLVPKASAYDHHGHHYCYDRDSAVYYEPYYGYYRPRAVVYSEPYYSGYYEPHYYYRPHYSRPRFAFTFGF